MRTRGDGSHSSPWRWPQKEEEEGVDERRRRRRRLLWAAAEDALARGRAGRGAGSRAPHGSGMCARLGV